MQSTACILRLPDSVKHNLMQYLSDTDIAHVKRTSLALNADYSQLTGSNNYYWITRLEKAFEETATHEMINELQGIDLEKVYKNLDISAIPNLCDGQLHKGNMDTTRVLLMFDHFIDDVRKELVNASSNGFYELTEFILRHLTVRTIAPDVPLAEAINLSIIQASSGECYVPLKEDSYAMSHAKTLKVLLAHRHYMREGDFPKTIISALANMSQAPYDEPEIAEVLIREAVILNINMAVDLRHACGAGHHGITELILKTGIDLTDTYYIARAAYRGHIDILKLLVSYGANPLNTEGEALLGATTNGHINIVALLLDYGVDPGECENQALDTAVDNGHMDIIKLLVFKGADPLYNNCITIVNVYSLKQISILELIELYGCVTSTNQRFT